MATFKKTQLWLVPLCVLLVSQNSFCMELTTLNGNGSGSGSGTYSAIALEAGVIPTDAAQEEELTRKEKCKAKCKTCCKTVGKEVALGVLGMAVAMATGAIIGVFATKGDKCLGGPDKALDTCNNDRNSLTAALETCNTGRTQCEGTDLPGCQGSLATTQGDLTTCSGNLGTCETDLSAADALVAANDADAAQIDACRLGLGGTCGAGCKTEINSLLGSSTEVVAVAKAIKAAQDATFCDAACVAEMTTCMTS